MGDSLGDAGLEQRDLDRSEERDCPEQVVVRADEEALSRVVHQRLLLLLRATPAPLVAPPRELVSLRHGPYVTLLGAAATCAQEAHPCTRLTLP